MVKFKQVFCKHDYKPWANIYGDIIADFNHNRTILLCTKCKKRKFIKEFVEAPLNADSLYKYIALNKKKDPFADEDLKYIIKDKNLYEEYFGDKLN